MNHQYSTHNLKLPYSKMQNPFTNSRSLSSCSRAPGFSPSAKFQTFGEQKNYTANQYFSRRPVLKQVRANKQRSSSFLEQSHLDFKKSQVPSDCHKRQNFAKIKQYPCQQISYLLKNEAQVMQKMKTTIEKDKQKLQRDFVDFKKTLNHLADDLKSSISNSIDKFYAHFVDQFRCMKKGYINYCKIKKNFWERRSTNDSEMKTKLKDKQFICNQNLLQYLADDVYTCKKFINYGEFSQIQQAILKPILHNAKFIYNVYHIDSYYKVDSTHQMCISLHNSIQKEFHKIYENLDVFVVSLDEKPKQQKTQSFKSSEKFNAIKHELRSPQLRVSETTRKSSIDKQNIATKINNFSGMKPINNWKSNKDVTQKYANTFQKFHQMEFDEIPQFTLYRDKMHNNQRDKEETPICSLKSTLANYNINVIKNLETNTSTAYSTQQECKNRRQSSQSSLSESKDLFQFGKKGSAKNDSKSTKQTALCMIYLRVNNKIAVGTQNGIIKIFCAKTRRELQKIDYHQSSVCSLAEVSDRYLVSGGDMGCCRVAVWELSSGCKIRRDPVCHFDQHQAAVTSIVDFQDGKHFLSASFDRSFKIYNQKRKQLKQSIETDQQITMVALSNNKQNILSGHLSNFIGVWQICRNNFNSIGSLKLYKRIQLESYPVSLITPSCYPSCVLVAEQNKKMRLVQIDSNRPIWQQELLDIVQQFVQIHQQNDSRNLILCLKNGQIRWLSLQKQGRNCVIGQGCSIVHTFGVGPKAVLTHSDELFIVNQKNADFTQISSWKIPF